MKCNGRAVVKKANTGYILCQIQQSLIRISKCRQALMWNDSKNAGKAFLFRQKSYLTAFQPELKSCKLLFRDPGRIEDTAVIVFPVFNMTVNKRHDRTAVVEHAGSRFAVTLITLVFI